jgi:hypothetical protein
MVEQYKPQIIALCQTLPIKQLGVFGSVLTDNFHEQSDIDILVQFEPDAEGDYFNYYFDLKEALETLFARPVDLVVDKPFKNPYFQRVVDNNRRIIYERRV